MTISTSTLLWITVIVLLLVVAYLGWRLWMANSTRASVAADTDTPHQPAEQPTRPVPAERRGAPPPAWAGQASATGPSTGSAPARTRPAPPASAGGGRTAPPASSGGGRPTPAGESYGAPRPRTSKPPPALAGNVPGYTPPSTSAAPRQRTSRPPAASAGGGDGSKGGKQSSDPEPAGEMARNRKATAGLGNPPARANPAAALAAARSWGYQLQDLDIAEAAASPFDLLVIDYARDGSDDTALTRKDVARLKQRAGGTQRLVYAYVSVGEAESYRFYWQADWKKSPPLWLLSENPDWKENFAVAYWDQGWQRILFGSPQAYIDRIAAAGFDGIYLDKCDVHEDLARREKAIARTRDDPEADMAHLIGAIADYVRRNHPGLGIIMQNAEHLLERDAVRDAIDAVAKEELLYGQSGGARRNAKSETADSKAALDLLHRDGKAVFVVEYLDDAKKAAEAAAEVRGLGYVPYIAKQDRELATLEAQEALIA